VRTYTRARRLAGVVLAASLLATACGGSTDGDTGTDGTEDTGTDGTEGTDAPEPGALGQVIVPAGEAIQIRSLQAISGDVAFLGLPNQRGTELAIEDYGQIQGFDVELGTPLDDLCDSAGGQSAAQTIVADEQVVGVIGTSCSGAAVAAMPLISQAGMVMISPSNTSPSLTSDLAGTPGADYQPGYYRTAHNDLFQGQAVAEFLFNDKGVTKAAAIHDGDPYTEGLSRAFADAFEALGGEITAFTAVNKGDTDMTGALTEAAQGEPGALFFPIFMPEAGFIVQQIGDIGGLSDAILISADGTLTDNFIALPESVGVFHSGPNLSYGSNENELGTSADEFLARYEEAYGETPAAAFWAHSYDATALLLRAIDRVAVVDGDGNLVIDRQALRDELTATSGYSGIIGTINCDEFGDCGAQRISIVEHLEGETTAQELADNIVFEFEPGA
jgi:branched-chain amino acid transport system substrate-binding protein